MPVRLGLIAGFLPRRSLVGRRAKIDILPVYEKIAFYFLELE
jgi:hypothetical protein